MFESTWKKLFGIPNQPVARSWSIGVQIALVVAMLMLTGKLYLTYPHELWAQAGLLVVVLELIAFDPLNIPAHRGRPETWHTILLNRAEHCGVQFVIGYVLVCSVQQPDLWTPITQVGLGFLVAKSIWALCTLYDLRTIALRNG